MHVLVLETGQTDAIRLLSSVREHADAGTTTTDIPSLPSAFPPGYGVIRMQGLLPHPFYAAVWEQKNCRDEFGAKLLRTVF